MSKNLVSKKEKAAACSIHTISKSCAWWPSCNAFHYGPICTESELVGIGEVAWQVPQIQMCSSVRACTRTNVCTCTPKVWKTYGLLRDFRYFWGPGNGLLKRSDGEPLRLQHGSLCCWPSSLNLYLIVPFWF